MIDVRCGERLIGISSHPIRVEPRMQLHVAGMTLLDHILQRVPQRFGSHALLPGQILAPRFKLRTIKGIGRRAHLKNNRIDTDMLQTIQHLVEIVLHRIPIHLHVVTLTYRVNPCAAKFSFRVFCTLRHHST